MRVLQIALRAAWLFLSLPLLARAQKPVISIAGVFQHPSDEQRMMHYCHEKFGTCRPMATFEENQQIIKTLTSFLNEQRLDEPAGGCIEIAPTPGSSESQQIFSADGCVTRVKFVAASKSLNPNVCGIGCGGYHRILEDGTALHEHVTSDATSRWFGLERWW